MICGACNGEGTVEYNEDERLVHDVCYHCAGTGEIDEQLARSDKLVKIANMFGEMDERAFRQYANDDPLGDGYDLFAAENMMSTYDYFRSRVWDREAEYAQKLFELSAKDQDLLIAWYEMPAERQVKPKSEVCDYCFMELGHTVKCPEVPKEQCGAGDDDIPF